MTEQLQPLAKKKPSRLRRWAKIAALVIGGLFLTGFLSCSGLMLWGSRRIHREIEAVKAQHEPTNWDELLQSDRDGRVVSAPVSAAQRDAASLYSTALAQAKGWDEALPDEFTEKLRWDALSPEEAERIGRALSNYQKALEGLRQAAQCDGIVNLPEASIEMGQELGELFMIRAGVRLLRAQACYLASQGRGDEAADMCIVMLRCAHAFPGYNMDTGFSNFAISKVACRTIEDTQAAAPSSAEKLDALMYALRQSLDDTPLSRILCGERVCYSHLLQSNVMKGAQYITWPNHAAYLEFMRECVHASREPFPASLRAMEQVSARYAKPMGPRYLFHFSVAMLAPLFDTLADRAAAPQAHLRATLVSLAIRRARLDGMPLPTGLQELVPKYLSAIPADPFTGEPLRYRVTETGCVIYSVGPDGVDNGGAIEEVIGSSGRPEKDIVVRLSP